MSVETGLTRRLGIRHPVVQAGMAGGTTTPRLVAAVSEAGGLGTLGAGYLSPDDIRAEIRAIRQLTGEPFAVNLFIPKAFDPTLYPQGGVNALLAPYRRELGIEDPAGPLRYVHPFDDQLTVVVEERVPVFSFTFGIPDETQLLSLKEAGVVTFGTATSVREARELEAAGVDLVTAQGSEAGGHRGTFTGGFEASMVGTLALVPQVVDSVSVPVVASGGIMDGRGLAAALVLGAAGAQMGTAFLTCPESGAHPDHKEAVLGAGEEDTAVTRAFSGKPARGLRNRFMDEVERRAEEIPPYPIQNANTRDIRARPPNRISWSTSPCGPGRPHVSARGCRQRGSSKRSPGRRSSCSAGNIAARKFRQAFGARRVNTVISGRHINRRRR